METNTEMMKIKNNNKYIIKSILSIISGFIILFVYGSIYSSTLLSPFIISYLHSYNDNIKIDDGFWFFGISFISTSVSLLFGGYLDKVLKIRINLIISGILCSGCYVILSFTKTLFFAYISYGLFGFGIGIGILGVMRNSCLHFPKNKGFVTGIIMGGFGLSSVILNYIIGYMVNPNNINPGNKNFYPEEVYNNIPIYMLYASIFFGGLLLIGIIFTFEKEKLNEPRLVMDNDYSVSIIEGDNNKSASSIKTISTIENTNIKERNEFDYQILKKYIFSLTMVQLFIYQICLFTFSSTYFNTFKYFTGLNKEYISEWHTLNIIFIMNLSNFIFRPIWGWVNDKIDLKLTLYIMYSLQILVGFNFYWTINILPLVYINILFVGISLSFVSTYTPAIVYKIYGTLYGSQIYSIVYLATGIGGIIIPIISKILNLSESTAGKDFSYMILYSSGGFLGVVGLINTYLMKINPYVDG